MTQHLTDHIPVLGTSSGETITMHKILGCNHIRDSNLCILQYIPLLAKSTHYKQSQKVRQKKLEENLSNKNNYRTFKRSSGNNIRPGQSYKTKQRKGSSKQ